MQRSKTESKPKHDSALSILEPPSEPLRLIVARRPLYLRIETVNVCNARCVFCAYPKSERSKSVMSDSLFRKIIRDYVEMGGGAVSLTPIVGDVLLDPMLIARLRLLRAAPSVTRIAFITNAIAWDRYDEQDRRFILESVQAVDISTGGPDRQAYRRMFAVDCFETVVRAVTDMCELKARYGLAVEIHVGLRVDRSPEKIQSHSGLKPFQRPEVDSLTVMNEFGNWGGMVGRSDLPGGARLVAIPASLEDRRRQRRRPCFVHAMNPEITCDGKVAVCVCGNAQTPALIIGDVADEHLRDIWQGDRRKRLIASYGTESLNEVCLRCSAYQDGSTWLSHPALQAFSIGDDPWDLIRKYESPAPSDLVRDTVIKLKSQGYKNIALYGAGRFAREALRALDLPGDGEGVVAIIDDDRTLQGTCLEGLPIIAQRTALERGIDAAVIASLWHGDRLMRAAEPLRRTGVHVVHPLAPTCERRHP